MNDTFERVRKCVCEALSVDEHEVKPETKLTHDLGAESIDLLDLCFRIEREFDITAPRKDFFPEAILTDATCVSDGILTSVGLAELKRTLPFVDFSGYENHPVLADFPAILSVADICRYVTNKIDEGTATPVP